ncbi:MAG: hypothetical protein IM585_00205 [Pseudanabaena sp. M135S2SP2A07QC]|jgi:hypothetical protein|nr:hypothetical protein [Pseudanabaena sp. M090S1SP2A07QC]MCA6506804.1 hypothetical protein [Pseudanabaena sp. M172S2SP2A07QC]MCA6523562.1 hypothetical protein [Pseudanabaena sp. M051S1SP2A07QC]MCA6528710.1 hypothetical protein [Pseudanabaena sp. M125S2SP2A07QC]MCA6535667.1 hypothetical protein [Pseudanabaena sp. M176S2SP2A07QC]MCA6540079.1 hypothetical protein [Pseudanabaena sp. M037S2SP2A07QC]MCA6541703.1 hypothetical protein [Pseudanabaena sp. M074S1SP2A07QC]MCA6549345.1 hypothetical prot
MADPNKWEFTDKSGTAVITSKFDAAYAFSNRLAMVFISGKLGYIDKSGRYIWQPAK